MSQAKPVTEAEAGSSPQAHARDARIHHKPSRPPRPGGLPPAKSRRRAPSSAGISKGILRSLTDAKKLRLTRGRKDPGRGWWVQGPRASFPVQTQTQSGVGRGLQPGKGAEGHKLGGLEASEQWWQAHIPVPAPRWTHEAHTDLDSET